MRKLVFALVASATLVASTAAFAAEAAAPPSQSWSFSGVFGTFDRAAAQRGYQVYKEVCSACHSLSQIRFRNLQDLGFSEDEVKALAAGYEVTDGPNDEGQMFQRPAKPADRFVAPFPNEKAARAANNSAYPPDLSLMTKARKDGANYVYALLTGYGEPPAAAKLMEGMNYNKFFPGNQIAMGQPLNPEQVAYTDGTKATVEQMSHDVVTFLAWSAEPELEARKRLGVKVLLFLLVLTALLYAVKRKVWRNAH
ncbi:MAG: cytochrome c1 [Rhodospirillales bacterium]|nr:cytochrome c1 [Rhodospirillales bacterium]